MLVVLSMIVWELLMREESFTIIESFVIKVVETSGFQSVFTWAGSI